MMQVKKERKAGLVRVRNGFSDVTGIAPQSKTIQLNEFDDDTRVRISNKLFSVFEIMFEKAGSEYHGNHYYSEIPHLFCLNILNDVFCQRNTLPQGRVYDWRRVFESIHEVIEHAPYNEVLDIVEYSCRWIEIEFKSNGIVFSSFNNLFEREYVGYRFVGGRIVAISDQTEIEAIEMACSNPVEGYRIQLQKAVDFLADRKNRDYKNSIKESICAVESLCKVIVNNEKATLGDALKQLEVNGVVIHPSLKSAFLKLYGYTSDQGGIRHAEGLLESEVTFEDAKFMLVSCSAFINYLITKLDNK